MKRIIIPTVTFFSFLLTSCSSVDSLHPFNAEQAAYLLKQNRQFYPTQQSISFNLPHPNTWQRIDVSYETVGTPIMYIPTNETRKNWTQSIRTQIRSYERHPNIDASHFIDTEVDKMQQYCSDVEGGLLSQQEKTAMYEITLKHCANQPDQKQYGKILTGKDALYVIYYSWTRPLSPDTAVKSAINDANLVNAKSEPYHRIFDDSWD